MQYPIIDNLISAYQNNSYDAFLTLNGNENWRLWSDFFYMSLADGTDYIISSKDTTSFYYITSDHTLRIKTSDAGASTIAEWKQILESNNIKVWYRTTNFNLSNNNYIVYSYLDSNNNYSLFETATQISIPTKTDISNRLKLPLLLYYPHSVINAVLSLKNRNTMTQNQVQVVNHYLKPLGLGGV